MKYFAIYETRIGYIQIGYENNKVTYLKKIKEKPSDLGVKTKLSDNVINQINEYLEGNRKEFKVDINLKGTDFQKKVWYALCDIPYGETRTYKEIAIAVGNEKASRAIGMANNKNPISIIVPCHRVIGSNGKLVGYAGGLDMKEDLLKLEKKL